jgi:hypothetical protein
LESFKENRNLIHYQFIDWLKFTGLLALGSHGLADDYDGLHCLDCVTFSEGLLGCSQQGNFFPTDFFLVIIALHGS